MQSLATKIRINQVTLMILVSFMFYELTNWEEGIWVIISTTVVSGPFSTFLTFEKARNRFLGTMMGLLVAAFFEYYLRYNETQLPVVATIIAFMAGFMATKSYQYFLIVITSMICLGFTYMNIPYTSFEPVDFLVARGMGVFTGICIFIFMQKFIFGDKNSKLELLEESYNALSRLKAILKEYKTNPSLEGAFKCSADINSSILTLSSYVKNCNLVFGKTINETVYAKQVLTLNHRAIKLLIDEPEINEAKLNRLINIVDVKLEH